MADPCGVRATGEAVGGVIDAVWDGPARPGQVILPDGSTDLLVAGDEVRVVGVMSRARILTVTRPVRSIAGCPAPSPPSPPARGARPSRAPSMFPSAREVRALTGLTPSTLVPPMSGTFKRRSRGA
jgi:hypothetical protein